MKVVAFNGSARKDGNTAILLNRVLEELQQEGLETELVQLSGHALPGCIACYRCRQNKNGRCAVEGDIFNDCLEKMRSSEGILLGSPTYVSDVSASLKALMERATIVSRANQDLLRRKVGAAVVSVRRAGSVHAFSSINFFFLINQVMIPGSNYWNLGIGLAPGDVHTDEEGIKTMRLLGQNMAWLLKKINGS